jgi:type II secretory pathway pseudopilin PulG
VITNSNLVRRLRDRASLRGSEAGISIVELLVAMILFTLVSALILSMFINATRAVAQASALSQNTQTAANIENEMTRVIRSAFPNPVSGGTINPAVAVGGTETLTVISIVDSGNVTTAPIQVVFSLNAARQVVEKRYAPTVDVNGLYVFTSPTLTSTRTLPGSLVVPTGATPTYLFTYYDASNNPLPVSGTLTAAQRALIDSIRINIVTNASGDPTQKPITIANTVTLANVN